MAVVKLTKKEKLDALAAKLTLDLKKKINQQELLDLCVEYATNNYDKIVELLAQEEFELTTQKVNQIKEIAIDFEEFSNGSIDDDIYEI